MRCAYLPPRAPILRRWMLHHLLLRACRESFVEATVQDRPEHRLLPVRHRAAVLPQPVCPGRYSARDLKGNFGDAIVQDCSKPPARSERCLVTNSSPASAPGGALGRCTPAPARSPRGTGGPFREEALISGSTSGEPRFSSSIFLFLFLFPSRAEARSEFVSSSFSPYLPHQATTLFRKTSVTLVACPLVSPRSRMLLPPTSELGRFGPCRPSEGPRWSLPGKSRAGSEGEVGSKVPYQPGGSRNKIPFPIPVSVEQDFVGEES